MKTLNTKKTVILASLLLVLGGFSSAVVAQPTPAEIQASVDAGVVWLVSQQDANGSWQNHVGITGFALIKLQERAHETGLDPFETDPLEPDYYEYATNVIDGWEYLFTAGPWVGTHARKRTISVQTWGDPDTNGNGYGISFRDETYYTGICLMALASSRAPNRANDGGLDYNGDTNPDTLGEIAQEVVDWLAYAQNDSGSQEGAWGYSANQGHGDNSITGYAVLGLAYAKAPLFGFNCTVPGFVDSELNKWVNYIQCKTFGPDYGGSGYSSTCYWVNELKTGNLIFEMTYLGDATSTPRFQDAMGYIETHWQDNNLQPGWGYGIAAAPIHYQAMYCLMKGLVYSGIS
ncbi:MAG: hypothetical protein ACYTA5_08445, partial [Planctomycetota bacterium]